MSTGDNTPIDHNKDYDCNGNAEIWSDSRIENAIFNRLMDAGDKYTNQATEKFRYFRLTSSSVFFDIDLEDITDDVINQLDMCTNKFKTKEEKYSRLDSIIAKAIFLVYKKGVEPEILSTTKEDQVLLKSSINEIPSLISHKWRLINSNQKVSIASGLSELIGHALPPPSSSPENNEIGEEQLFNDDNNYLEQEKEKPKANESTISGLLASVKNRCIEIIKDQFNEFYVTLKINDHVECVPFESDRFKNVIRNEYFEEKGQILSDDRLDGILKLIESQMMYNDDIKTVDLNLRVAKTGNGEDSTFYYDLTNQKWEILKITSEGWDIVKDNSIPIFKRYDNNNSPQVIPSKEYGKEAHWDRFLKLFNLETKSDIVLLSVYMVSLFVPDIPKGILVLSGNGGGAKTMTFKMIKNIVDPGSADTFSFPKQVNDLVQILSHHHVNFFDNVSSISNEVSDILCRAVSGASFSKRALYTNDNDIIYKFKRCIGINGINLVTTRPDFLDRAIVIMLNRIPNDKRKKECDIDRQFEELRPFVLGHILDVLVKVLRYRKEHKNEKILKEYPEDGRLCGMG